MFSPRSGENALMLGGDVQGITTNVRTREMFLGRFDSFVPIMNGFVPSARQIDRRHLRMTTHGVDTILVTRHFIMMRSKRRSFLFPLSFSRTYEDWY